MGLGISISKRITVMSVLLAKRSLSKLLGQGFEMNYFMPALVD